MKINFSHSENSIYCEKSFINIMKLAITKPSVIKLLYQMTFDAKRILDANNIKFWAIGGTILGAQRHKGIIPWDDDVDFGVTVSSIKKILSISGQFKKCGYQFVKTWFGYKMVKIGRRNIRGENYSFPNIDFFTFRLYRGIYKQSEPDARHTWPKEWYRESQIKNLEIMPFGDFDIYVPKMATKYLDRMYGKNWNSVAYRQYDHSKEEAIEKKLVKLTAKDRVPAKPTRVIMRKCISH